MKLGRWWFSLGVAVWVGALGSMARTAAAQSAPSLVVVVAADPSTPAARRLSTDLQGIGLDVLVLRATPENSSGRESLEQTARGVGAIAAVRLVPSGAGTEVWVADRVTGKTVIRQLVRPGNVEAEPDDVALGAVELLRASLMELHASPVPRGDAEVTPAIRELAFAPSLVPSAPPPVEPPWPPQLSLMAGPGVELDANGMGPSLQGYWALGIRLAGPIVARVFVSLPIVPAGITVSEGAVDVSSDSAGLGAYYEFDSQDRKWLGSIGVGPAVAHVKVTGRANAPLLSAASAGWKGGAQAQAGAAVTLSSGARLRLDFTTILLIGAPDIVANDRSIGRWGDPALLLALGLELTR